MTNPDKNSVSLMHHTSKGLHKESVKTYMDQAIQLNNTPSPKLSKLRKFHRRKRRSVNRTMGVSRKKSQGTLSNTSYSNNRSK